MYLPRSISAAATTQLLDWERDSSISFCAEPGSRLPAALVAGLQMHAHNVGHLSLADPAFSKSPFASFRTRSYRCKTPFVVSGTAHFKFFHLHTRHSCSLRTASTSCSLYYGQRSTVGPPTGPGRSPPVTNLDDRRVLHHPKG